MKKLFLLFLPPLLVIITISCSKNGALNAGGSTLDKVIFTSPGAVTDTTIYQYDSQNRLLSITQAPLTNGGTTFSFTYDPAGNLSGYTQSAYLTGNILSYAFQYDNNGRIVKSIGTPLMANLGVADYAYTYDAQGRLIADTQLIQKTQAVAYYSTFTYDANNNITQTEQFDLTTGTLQKLGTGNNTYYNRANPYFAIRIPLFMIYNDGSLLSANNVNTQQSTSPNGSVGDNTNISSYSYYGNGLVWRQVMSNHTNTNSLTLEYHFKTP